MSELVGQTLGQQTLMESWHSGRLHHAWLLNGPRGIGKATLAHRFARTVLRVSDAMSPSHADLLVVARAFDEKGQPQRSEILLENVRPVGAFLRRTAVAGGWRVVIIDGVDRLNRSAANALLKLLEEPPARVLFLLVCDAPGRLPATLRSRCRSLRLFPLDEDAMSRVLERQLPEMSGQERAHLISLSHGSPGRAIALAADDGLAISALVQDALARSGQGAGLWSYDLAESVLRRENGFSTFLGLLSDTISTTLLGSLRSGGGWGENALLADRGAGDWAGICTSLGQIREETEQFNLDKRQAVLASLSMLSRS